MFKAGQLVRWEPTRRLRVCPICDRPSSDRVFHDSKRTGRCLPVFDHFCSWLLISVYLRTIKAYLSVNFWLPVDLTATSILFLGSSITPLGRIGWPFAVGLSVLIIALCFGAFFWAWTQWKHLALRNEVELEWRAPRKPTLLAFKVTLDGHDYAYFANFDDNPWDLGPSENMHQVLGRNWWMVSALCYKVFRDSDSTNS